ncbi:MAG: asparaginase domain-containing protein [Chitinophagales bacterium]
MEQILVLSTGGTFDKTYDLLTGHLHFQESFVPSILTLGRSTLDTETQTIFLKDSLDIVDQDRESIANVLKNSMHKRIVITHGTDSIAETASFLESYDLGKTIVLTGAMIPYSFGASDALFNLGSALAFAQFLNQGVYVAMNGKYYKAGAVKKNRSTGYFEAIQ